MRKEKHKLAIYKKMYGHTLPTKEKLENAGMVTEIVIVSYYCGLKDAELHRNTLAELEKIVNDKYDTPGCFKDWLIDAIRKAYREGYAERSAK